MISAGSRRGSSHALVPWNREQAWSASGPSGGHAFSGRTDSNRLNTEQQIGHASVTRSRTLVLSRNMITFDAALSTSKLEAVEYDLGPTCCAIETSACAQTRTNIPLGVLALPESHHK